MAYDDKKFGTIFPTRFGSPTGSSNERQMLDAIEGADSFRKRYRTMADGTKVRLETNNGMPRFFTEKPISDNEPIFMDSGAIDLGGLGSESAERFNNAILHYGTTQRLYAQLRQLLGKLWPKSMACEPPSEEIAAESFLVSANQLGQRDQDLLDLLYLKKLCAAYAGASMFCGKARLYAQAQYGTKLREWKWTVNVSGGDTPSLQSTIASGVKLTTNSGLYVDAAYRHWLIDIDNLGCKITRLARDARVIPLVERWKLMSPTDTDYDKVEAYILAYSQPDPSMSFWLAIPGNPGCWMFGYGWKFNWSGTCADVIHTDVIPTGSTTSKYRSTHYRVTFSRNESTYIPTGVGAVDAEKSRWSAVLETVEGPVDWKADKWGEVIASPLWGSYELEIFGELWGDRFAADAPIYCFYRRDELELIRYTRTGGDAGVKYMRHSIPTAWMGRNDWSVEDWTDSFSYGTIGLDGATGETRVRSYSPEVSGFYGSSYSAVLSEESYTYDRKTMGSKTYNGVVSWYVYPESWTRAFNINNSYYTETLLRYASDGIPLYLGAGAHDGPDAVFESTGMQTTQSASFTANLTFCTGTHSETCYLALIIPFGDAEAAYYYASRGTTRIESGASDTGTWNASGLTYVTEYDVNQGHFTVYGGGTSLPAAPSTPYTSNETTYEVNSMLSTSSGLIPFAPPSSMSPFFAGEPNSSVPQTYWTRTSLEGACFGYGAKNLLGFDDFDSPPPFIGWA